MYEDFVTDHSELLAGYYNLINSVSQINSELCTLAAHFVETMLMWLKSMYNILFLFIYQILVMLQFIQVNQELHPYMFNKSIKYFFEHPVNVLKSLKLTSQQWL